MVELKTTLPLENMTDFDRTAIGSLEDLQREWSGLDAERAKVEDKLRSFDAARLARERPSIGAWRNAGGDRGISRDIGRGGRGGPGGGGNAGARLGDNNRLRSGETVRSEICCWWMAMLLET